MPHTHRFREVSDGWQTPVCPESLSPNLPQQPFYFLIFPCSPSHSTKYPQPCTSLSGQRAVPSLRTSVKVGLHQPKVSLSGRCTVLEVLLCWIPLGHLDQIFGRNPRGLILAPHVRRPCPWSSDHMHSDRPSGWWGFMVDRE